MDTCNRDLRTPDQIRVDFSSGLGLVEKILTTVSRPACILDAGCGQGIPVLIRTGGSITGIGLDISLGPLRRAKVNAPTALPILGDMTNLPFQEKTFDAVIARHSVHHVPPDSHQAIIEAFARVLQPGGLLLLVMGETELEGIDLDKKEETFKLRSRVTQQDTIRNRLTATGFVISSWGVVKNKLTTDAEGSSFFIAQYDV